MADGGVPDESGVSDRGETDGGSGSVCSSGTHLFCDDFDDGFDPRWKLNATGSDGALTLAPAAREGQMLVATLPDGTSSDAYLSFPVDTEQAVRVAFDARIADPAWSNADANFAIVQLLFTSNDKHLSANVYIEPDGPAATAHLTYEVAADPPLRSAGREAFTFGGWRHVVLEADFGNNGRAALRIGGEAIGLTATFASPEGMPSLRLGIFRPNGRTPALRVEIDNLVVDPL